MSASSQLKEALKKAIKPPRRAANQRPPCQTAPLSAACAGSALTTFANDAANHAEAGLAVAVDYAATGAEDALLVGAAAGLAGGPVGLAGTAVCLIGYAALKYKDEIWEWGKDVFGFSDPEAERRAKLRRENRQAASNRAVFLDMLRMALINRAEEYLKDVGLEPLLLRVGSRDWVEGSNNERALGWMNRMTEAWGDDYSPEMTRERIFSKTGDNPRLGGGFGRKGCFTVKNQTTNDAAWWLTSTHIICDADKNRYIFAARPQGQEYYAAIEAYLAAAMQGADKGTGPIDAFKTYFDANLHTICATRAGYATEHQCKLDALTWTIYLSYWDTKGGPVDHWKGVEVLKRRYPRELEALVAQDRIPLWRTSKAAFVAHTREGLKRPLQDELKDKLKSIRLHQFNYTENLSREIDKVTRGPLINFVYQNLTEDTETYLVNGVETRKLTQASRAIWNGWAGEVIRQSAAYKKAQELPNRCVVPAPYVQAIDNEDWCKGVETGLYDDVLTDQLRNEREHLVNQAIEERKLPSTVPRIYTNADARASYALAIAQQQQAKQKISIPILRKASVGFTATATILGTAALYYLLMHRRDR